MNKEEINEGLISLENEKVKIVKNAKTQNRNRLVGIVYVIIGLTLLILGIAGTLFKGNSVVTFTSLPVIFFGVFFWYNSRNSSFTTGLANIESQFQKLKQQIS